MKFTAIIATLVVGLLATSVAAQQAVDPKAAAPAQPAVTPQGAALFKENCASCHDPAVERAPTMAELKARTPEYVLRSMTDGIMKGMAANLSQGEMRSIATFVTEKTFAPVVKFGGQVEIKDRMCARHPPIRTTPTSWNGWGRDAANTRFQPNGGLKAADVPKLKVKWAFSYKGGRYGQPNVVGDHLFVSSSGGAVYALDAKTGCVHWRFDVPGGSRHTVVVERRPGASPSGWVAYFGDFIGGYVYALDAQTGRQIWRTRVEDHVMGRLGGAPVIHGNLLYIPTSSHEEVTTRQVGYQCCTFRGAVVAIELPSGKIKWRTYMTEEPKPTRRPAEGIQNYGPAGAAIWSPPTIDAKRGSLYVTTGDSYTEVPTDKSDAVVALDLATGRIKWVYQATEADNYMGGCGGPEANRPAPCPLGVIGRDVDFGAPPILAKAKDGREILLAGQKSSDVFGIDPDTGRLLWKTNVGAGSALGGIEWGMAAMDGVVYVPNSDVIAPAARAKPGLTAIDIGSGRELWHQPAPKVSCTFFGGGRCSNAQAAPATLIPGIVFSGTIDGHLRAYEPATGKVLWDFATAGQTYDTVNGVKGQVGGSLEATGPVVAGGMMYVLSGYDGSTRIGGNEVNVLLAFSVDGK